MDPIAQLLLALLALAFGMWSGVVLFIGQGIRTDLRGIGADLKQESKRLNEYILQTETRLTRLEENHE